MTAAFLRANRRTWTSLRKHRNYRIFFSGQVVSVTGTWMQNIAAAWLILELTGSGFAVGVTSALQFLPMLLFGAWGGVLADRCRSASCSSSPRRRWRSRRLRSGA